MVFDAPGLKCQFKKRLDQIEKALANKDSSIVKLHHHYKCESQKHLDSEMDKVLAKGGEGLMIKDPKCRYEHRRSDKLLKIKTFLDSEAIVIGHENGSGRCENMLGALRVKDAKTGGRAFKIGSGFTDAVRLNPPKIGSTVTYKY